MPARLTLLRTVALTTLVGVPWTMATQVGVGRAGLSARPTGPCDIYAAAGDPCVAAHSTTRALYATYHGPLYQILRQADGKTLDIGVVPSGLDAGGYADAEAQDAFCANTYCWITTLYDQSPQHNDLTQAPRGGFSGPAMGGFNNLPLADMAPVTVMGHKVYGVFIEPGMGLRADDPKGTAVDDQAEGQYWVINGQHYNSGCCFDYGNAEDRQPRRWHRHHGDDVLRQCDRLVSRERARAVGHDRPGEQPGRVRFNPDRTKVCAGLPNVTSRFVTAMAKGEAHHWTSMGGDAQQGALTALFDGPRVDRELRSDAAKQGAILLGNGGDNSNLARGGHLLRGRDDGPRGRTFPLDATDQLIQANVVAARYDLPRLTLAPASAPTAPPGLQTWSPGSSQDATSSRSRTRRGRLWRVLS